MIAYAGIQSPQIGAQEQIIVKKGYTLNDVTLKARHNPKLPHYSYPLPNWKEEILNDIIECESGWDYTAKNPNSTAYGYCQFLYSTRRYVERKWEMDINFNDPEQQMYACRRLFDEEGLKHWRPSKNCWGR